MLCAATLLAVTAFGNLDAALFPAHEADLKFNDLFPRRNYFGRNAAGLSWSHDGRYLAYFWNPYDTPYSDLWIYDTQTGKSTVQTNIEMFAAYDRTIPKAIERYKKDKEDRARQDRMSDDEYRKWEIEERKRTEERRDPQPSYPGPQGIEWSKKSHEFMFSYKGDVFRWKVGEKSPTRLFKTREAETQYQYLPDDSGFVYRRGDGVFRVKFESSFVEQLNPELPAGQTFGAFRLLPDGSKLMISASRQVPGERQVDYITYRGRFAQAQKTNRSVADDKFSGEQYLYLYDVNDDPIANPKNDGKPWEIWKWAGGENFQETALASEPWSPDSKQFVFGAWDRDKKELQIITADVAEKKAKTVYKTTHDGEHRTPSMSDPFFTPDGKKIVTLLENSGWRHAWVIDPMQEGATQLTKGDFEVYPLECSPDGKDLFVRSSKENLARYDIYRVSMETGEMRRLTTRDGTYGAPAISEDGTKLALSYTSWKSLPETHVMDGVRGGGEKPITSSHRDGFWNTVKLQPQLFSYKNRHGQTVHGYMFLPPGHKKDQKRPLWIYVYGGPLGTGHSVWDGTFGSTDFRFNMYLAYVLGYVTCTIDPRGQSNYGSVFGKANWERPGVAQVEDLSDGVKWMAENYGIDTKKVGINGWSFGGFQTQMCLYTAPDVFTLGIAGAGPTEWQNYNTWYTGGVIGDSAVGKPEDLDKYSLTKLAPNLKSPLMLLHGVEDTNVLYQDTIMVYRVLQQHGKGPLVELAIDPTGGHGLGGDINTRDRHAIYLSFILKHWGDTSGKKW